MTKTMELTRKVFAADEMNFAPGAREFVAWVSTSHVDHEGDVVVAEGVDFKSVFLGRNPGEGNPVVLACHSYGTWPLGRCEWIKVKQGRGWTGLYAKTVLDDDPATEVVWQKIRNGTVRGVSIGFRPPDDAAKGEWGPPTPDELQKNPGWKGAGRVIRRCLLLEYSVVPLPMNPRALIDVVAKGVHRPVYATPEPPAMTDGTDPHDDAETPAVEPEPEVKAVEPEPEPEPDAETKAMAPDEEPDADDEAPEDDGPVTKGAFVRCVKGSYKGVVGKVKSLHRAGMVPDVDDDVMGTKAEPAARVNVYKAMGDGHRATDHHVGVKAAHLEPTDDLKPPKRKKGVDPVTLPPLTGRTDGQVAAEQVRTLTRDLRAAVRAEEDRALGAV